MASFTIIPPLSYNINSIKVMLVPQTIIIHKLMRKSNKVLLNSLYPIALENRTKKYPDR